MEIYTEYIASKAFRLINNKHDRLLKEHFFSPIGIETEFSYKDIVNALDRLKKLYYDGREIRCSLDSNNMLAEFLWHYYFDYNSLLNTYRMSQKAKDYYLKTKEIADSISGLAGMKKNWSYEVVIRNLLILGENIYKRERIVDLECTDISLEAVGLLCTEFIRNLFQYPEFECGRGDYNDLAAYVKKKGALPMQFTKYIDDPDKKGKIKYILSGMPQVMVKEEIRAYDCNCAHILYAMLLTALVEKLEVMH